MFDAITLPQYAVLPVSIDPQESAVVYFGDPGSNPNPPLPPKFSIEPQPSAVDYFGIPGSVPYPPPTK